MTGPEGFGNHHQGVSINIYHPEEGELYGQHG
jgi:hypothetical protein